MKKLIIIVAFLVVSVTSAVALATGSEKIAKVLNIGLKSEVDTQLQTNSIDLPNLSKSFATETTQPAEPQNVPVQINNIDRQTPDYVFFDMLFNRVKSLDEAAAKLESEGMSGRIWSEYLERRAGLSRQQVDKLRQVADEFNRAVEPTHRQAMRIINERRATVTSGQRPAPPSPQLLALQQQRKTIALAHGNRVKTLLGAEIVEQLRQLLIQKTTGGTQALSPSSAESQLLQEQLDRKENQNNE